MSESLSALLDRRAAIDDQIRSARREVLAEVRTHLAAARDLMVGHEITALDVTTSHLELIREIARLAEMLPPAPTAREVKRIPNGRGPAKDRSDTSLLQTAYSLPSGERDAILASARQLPALNMSSKKNQRKS